MGIPAVTPRRVELRIEPYYQQQLPSQGIERAGGYLGRQSAMVNKGEQMEWKRSIFPGFPLRTKFSSSSVNRMSLHSSSPSLLLRLLLPLLLPVSVVAIPSVTPTATATGDGWNNLPAVTAPHITPAPELRKRDTKNPLLDGECSQPILHVETMFVLPSLSLSASVRSHLLSVPI